MLLALAYQIVVVSFASYIVWFWLITQYAPSKLAAFTFLTPVSGVLFGALILDEPVTGPILAALALIGGGIYLVNRGQKTEIRCQKRPEPSSDICSLITAPESSTPCAAPRSPSPARATT